MGWREFEEFVRQWRRIRHAAVAKKAQGTKPCKIVRAASRHVLPSSDFGLRAIPPGTSISDLDFKIDAKTRTRVIDGAIENLNSFYVSPELAKKMEESVRARQKKDEYDAVNDGDALAKKLTDDFREVSHDKHLMVDFSPAKMPERPEGPPDANAIAEYPKQMEKMNCGFDKVEILSGNVGYVKFDMFADPDICGPTVVAAMNFLANVDAIIFDLRENGGGDPKMVALVSTYLFSTPTHLNDLWEPKSDSTSQYWTLPYVPGKRLDGKPAFVLTSKQTFQARRSSPTTSRISNAPPSLGRRREVAFIRCQVTGLTTTS